MRSSTVGVKSMSRLQASCFPTMSQLSWLLLQSRMRVPTLWTTSQQFPVLVRHKSQTGFIGNQLQPNRSELYDVTSRDAAFQTYLLAVEEGSVATIQIGDDPFTLD